MQPTGGQSLSQAKMLGGIGGILTLLLFVPDFIGTVLVIVGWVLIMIAIKQISDATGDRSIFSSAMISVILAIVGTAIFAVVVAAAVLGFVGLGNLSSTTPPTVTPGFAGLIGGIIAGLLVVWVFAVVGSYFLWKSFKLISARLNVGLFATAGLIYFVGSILTVILVGFILTFVAQILFIVAFFSLPETLSQISPMQPRPMSSP